MTHPLKRFFYTDPLAAAWMAKHFGMEFLFAEDDAQMHTCEFYVCAGKQSFELAFANFPARLYIHPDSLHLLDPRLRDVVEDGADYPTVIDDGFYVATGEPYINLRDAKGVPIIHRNGIPFHWPESEDA